MQNVQQNYEIDLTNCVDSQELVNRVMKALENKDGGDCDVDLKLCGTQINQSQMVFIKSLVESFGRKIGTIETSSDLTIEICAEMGIESVRINSSEQQEENIEPAAEENKVETETVSETENSDTETKESENSEGVQKQVIGVYRKADEKENEAEFKDEDVDFYATPTNETVVIDTKDTIYINQTLRNGQVVEYDGNVVIIGDCHPGSEIKATGDITVWGVLGSIAHAGIKGNQESRIRALKMNAVQLRIANCYSRRPDGGNIPYIVKSSVFTPEEARIVDDNIVLFKMAQN